MFSFVIVASIGALCHFICGVYLSHAALILVSFDTGRHLLLKLNYSVAEQSYLDLLRLASRARLPGRFAPALDFWPCFVRGVLVNVPFFLL